MSAIDNSLLPAGDPPDLYGRIEAPRGDVLAIRRTGERNHPVGMSSIRALELPGRRVPYPDDGVVTASSDSISLRQPDDVLNPPPEMRSMKVDDMQPCVGIPCLYVSVRVSHDMGLSIVCRRIIEVHAAGLSLEHAMH